MMRCIPLTFAMTCVSSGSQTSGRGFRHSVGSFVNAETGNLKLAQKLLGHSRYETTANIYTHSTSDQDREAAVAVEQAIFGESVRNVRENTNNKGSKVIN